MPTVTGVSRGTPAAQNAASAQDKEIQALARQKGKLEEEIRSLSDNKSMDDKLKMERIRTLRESIQQIDSQINQIKAEQLKEKMDQRQSRDTGDQKPPAGDPSSSAIHEAVAKSVTYEHLAKLRGVRNQLSNSATRLEGEVRIDRNLLTMGNSNDCGKSMMLENAESTVYQMKREMTSELQKQIAMTEDRMDKLMESAYESRSSRPQRGNAAPAEENPDAEPAETIRKQPQPQQAGTGIDIRI